MTNEGEPLPTWPIFPRTYVDIKKHDNGVTTEVYAYPTFKMEGDKQVMDYEVKSYTWFPSPKIVKEDEATKKARIEKMTKIIEENLSEEEAKKYFVARDEDMEKMTGMSEEDAEKYFLDHLDDVQDVELPPEVLEKLFHCQ